MARIVKRTPQEPTKYDGSHKLTRGEEAGKLYWYDNDGGRHEAKESYPDIRTF